MGVFGHVCVCKHEGWGGLQGSYSLCPTAAEARVLRPASCPPQLSLHATALSVPLFDNYLLCCLGQGWGHHTYITDTKTLATRVWPPPSDPYRPSPLIYTQNTKEYGTTRRTNQTVVSQALALAEANCIQLCVTLLIQRHTAHCHMGNTLHVFHTLSKNYESSQSSLFWLVNQSNASAALDETRSQSL